MEQYLRSGVDGGPPRDPHPRFLDPLPLDPSPWIFSL